MTEKSKRVRRPPRLRHGIYSTAVCTPDENPRDLAYVRRAMRRSLEPGTPIEELLVDQIVMAGWRLRRYARCEMYLVTVAGGQLGAPVELELDLGAWAEAADGDEPAPREETQERAYADRERMAFAYAHRATAETLDRLWLQEARLCREIRQTLRTLFAVQQARGKPGLPADLAAAVAQALSRPSEPARLPAST